jgi:hypothetical protein
MAVGKSPGDITYELREFSTITDMLQDEKVRRACTSGRRGCPGLSTGFEVTNPGLSR